MGRNNSLTDGNVKFEVVGGKQFCTAVDRAVQRLSNIDVWDESILPYLGKIEPAERRSFFRRQADGHTAQIPFNRSLADDDLYMPLALAKTAYQNHQRRMANSTQVFRRAVERQCLAFQRDIVLQLGIAADSTWVHVLNGMQQLLPPDCISDEQCFDISTAWTFLNGFDEKDECCGDYLVNLTSITADKLRESSQPSRRIETQFSGTNEYEQQIQAAANLAFSHDLRRAPCTSHRLRIAPIGRRYPRRTVMRRVRPFVVSPETAARIPTKSLSGYLVNEAKFRESRFSWTSAPYIDSEINSLAAQINALMSWDGPEDAIDCLKYHLVVLSMGKIPAQLRSWFQSVI